MLWSGYVSDAIALSNVSLEAKSMMAAHQVTPARVLQEVKNHGEKAVEVLKEAIAEADPESESTQEAFQGTPASKRTIPKPLARSKASIPSDNALKLADALCRLVLDPSVELDELERAARAYKKVRGI